MVEYISNPGISSGVSVGFGDAEVSFCSPEEASPPTGFLVMATLLMVSLHLHLPQYHIDRRIFSVLVI